MRPKISKTCEHSQKFAKHSETIAKQIDKIARSFVSMIIQRFLNSIILMTLTLEKHNLVNLPNFGQNKNIGRMLAIANQKLHTSSAATQTHSPAFRKLILRETTVLLSAPASSGNDKLPLYRSLRTSVSVEL